MNEIKEYVNSKLGEKYYDFTHKSGIRVLLCPKKFSTAYVSLGVKFGSLDSGYRADGRYHALPSGTAHFLEHKMFANPDGSDALHEFEALGESVNAYTSYEKTVYTFNCITENFGTCLEKLFHFVFTPYFTEENVAKEALIIGQEIKNDLDDPYETCYRRLIGSMYGVGNLKHNICGSLESIAKITPELLYRCHTMYYTAKNSVLSVCGDVTVDGIMRVLDSVYVPTESKKFTRVRALKQSKILKDKIVKSDVPRQIFDIGIQNRTTDSATYPVKIENNVAKRRLYRDTLLSLAGSAMFPKSGELYAELLEKGLLTDISFGSAVFGRVAYCELSGETDDFEQVYQIYQKYIDKICRYGIDSDTLIRARRVMYADFISIFDSCDDVSTQMLDAAFDKIGLFDYLSIIDSIDDKAVLNLIQQEFTNENTVVSLVIPK